mmetsp:Transcript_28076/g.24802  ORF Transcript_28076/g.24802 Transcript_28076/m.24802 type:complete len:150 (-) Transcript_28076:26-475(-)
MKVSLRSEDESFTTYIYPNGLFKFTNIPVGRYIMSVEDTNNFFDQAGIEIVEHNGKEGVRAFKYDSKNGKGSKLKHPIVFSPTAKKQYYEVKEPFNIMGIFKNPMILMMVVSLGLVFLMNKMPKPSKEEMTEMNKNMGGISSMLTGGGS